MRFFLGVHEPAWLAWSTVPLFVSHRRLKRRVCMPRATCAWALDSGGFTELSMHGAWQTEPADYIDAARRYQHEVGRLEWAAPMDWMCEPFMLEKTGLSVDRHQGLTVENLTLLRDDAPDVPWVPVLQGWTIDDYLRCVQRYHDAGIDLTAQPVVGVGSVCRRQATAEIELVFRELRHARIACHGFGVKTKGLGRYARHLASADSMAWSYDARRTQPMPGCHHASCQNCFRYALAWRERTLARLGTEQGVLL